MGDLADKIRLRAEDRLANCLEPQTAANAVIAVLTLHREYPQGWCVNDGFDWPCITVRDIAAVFSIQEAADGPVHGRDQEGGGGERSSAAQ